MNNGVVVVLADVAVLADDVDLTNVVVVLVDGVDLAVLVVDLAVDFVDFNMTELLTSICFKSN